MYFVGWSTTILFVPLFADKVGRKWIFFFSVLLTGGALTGMYLSNSVIFTIALMFVAGACNSGRVMVGFVFASEFFMPKWQVIFGTAFNFIDCSTGLLITLYFDFINKHYIYITMIGYVMTCISIVLCLAWIVESPLWQLKMGKVDEGLHTIRRMMKINGVDCEDEI